LFNLKKKVNNKRHVKALIYKVYIIKEILTFLYYFEPHLRIKINRISKHDNGREVLSSGNLLIFSHPEQLLPKNIVRGRY
jgi:hypothetical protein